MSGFDYAVVALYAVAVLSIGLRVGRGHGSAFELLLGGRALPAWAVLFSMIATELSAATFIGVPHAAYVGTWSYLQFAFGALVGKAILAAIVVPLYHRLRVVTVYGILELRYGPKTRRAAAFAFVVGRILASGVRLFIAALAFATVTGQSIEIAIFSSGILAIAYTTVGGIRSVVWTDVLQGAVFIAGALALVIVLGQETPGGLSEILRWGAESGRTKVFDFSSIFSLTNTGIFGTAFVGGMVLTLATHATDHDMVQRLLATRDGRSGGLALLGSGLLNFPLSMLFLFIGTGIAVAYASPPDYSIADTTRILPIFALHELPSGLRGLVFSGLFAAAMSSLDSATCAIATTWVSDIARRDEGDASGEANSDALAARLRRGTVVSGALLIGAAILMSQYHQRLESGGDGLSLVEFALSSMTILYGGLLGIFARAILIKRPGNDRWGVVGLAVGCGFGLALFLQGSFLESPLLAWTWWIPLSATVSFAVSGIGTSDSTLGGASGDWPPDRPAG